MSGAVKEVDKATGGIVGGALDAQTTWSTGGLDQIGGGGVGGVEKTWQDITGQTAADQAREAGQSSAEGQIRAAEIQAELQREQLDYLKEQDALTSPYRQAGLGGLAAMVGIGVDPETGQQISIDPTLQQYQGSTPEFSYAQPTQSDLIAQAQGSPLYDAIMGTAASGAEALARTSSATGGLRGGGTASQLAGFGQQLGQKALLESYGQQQALEQQAYGRALDAYGRDVASESDAYGRHQYGQQQQIGLLGSLMGLPSQTSNIANTMGAIGQTMGAGHSGAAQALAQSQIAAAQAQQQGMGNLLLGAAAISDERLKINIESIGRTEHPCIDRMRWEWGDNAKALGKEGMEEGFIAQDIEKVWPDLVVTGEDGYKRINKGMIEMRLKEI